MTIGIIGIIISLMLFVLLSFKNFNIATSAVISACIIITTNNIDPVIGFFDIFSGGFGNFASSWWSMFAIGALFGQVINDCGISASVVRVFLKLFRGNAILIVLLLSLVMAYGGIGTFVISFTIYPIAASLFKKEGISNELLPATMLFCPTTIAMTMLPGTPSIQNLIPTQYLDTTIYAAPILGIIAAIITFALGYTYLYFTAKKITVDKKNYNEKNYHIQTKDWLSFTPCALLWIVSFALIYIGFDSNYAVIIAMVIGIISAFIIAYKNCIIIKVINEGITNGLKTVAITSCVMGYGELVKSTEAFEQISDILFSSSNNFILSSIMAINVIAAITGSSTCSLQMFFDSFSNWIAASGINANVLHRVMIIASGGLDSMPYATGVAVANELAKTSQSKTYIHVFICCAIIPLISLISILLLSFH